LIQILMRSMFYRYVDSTATLLFKIFLFAGTK
jgi:hypothetical protein